MANGLRGISGATGCPKNPQAISLGAVGGLKIPNFTLTNGADALIGTEGDDIFVATEATLSSADILDGDEGTDTLRYASSGNAAVSEAGFEASNIETVQVTSDATGGTAFDVTGVTDLETLRNFNSSEDLALTGMDSLTDIELDRVGSAGALAFDPTPDTTLVFNAAVVAGNADELNVLLKSNLNVDGTGIGDLRADGVEVFNLTTETGASIINTITSNVLETINVTGDQDLTISSNLVGASTIDASTFTGDLDVTVDSALEDVTVTGGSGDDRADFSNGWDAGDIFDGGEGIDTLGLSYGVAATIVPANSGTATNVEVLDVTDAAWANGTIDMDNFGSVEKVILNQGINGGVTATIDDAVSGLVVEMDLDPVFGTGTLVVDLKTDGAADEVTLNIEEVSFNIITAINVEDAETLNISVADDINVAGTGVVFINDLILTDTTTLNLSGDAELFLFATNPATPVLSTINAADMTGDLNMAGVDTAAAGASITLGSGDDLFQVRTSNGADTITLGAGEDRIVYNAVAQSDRDMDTITDFVSGTDIIDVRALMGGAGLASSVQFVGNRATFGLAQGALIGDANGNALLDVEEQGAVFQVDEQILWVDVDGNGTLDNNDFRIKLEGVTSITAADLGFIDGVTFTANTVGAFSTWDDTASDEGVETTPEDDIINATVAQINSAATVIDGRGGADVLNISGTAAAAEIATLDLAVGQFLNVETINLRNTVEGVRLADGDIATVTRLAGATGKIQSLEVNNADLTDMNISNIETLIVNTDAEIDEDNFASFATITGVAGAILQLTGTDASDDFDFSAVTMTGITTLTLNTADVVTLDAADLANVTTINGGADADIVVNNTVDVSGITVTDAAVLSIAVAGNLTIDNGTDGDEFETITGTGGGRTLIIAAGGSTNISALQGFTNIDATALADGNLITLDDDITDSTVAIAIGDSDLNVTGVSTDALLVNALGGVVTQAITTAGGNDVITISAGATAATVVTGAGDDIIYAGALLTIADSIDGGAGNDTLYVTDDSGVPVTDFDGVENVETIMIDNNVASSYKPADAVVAAGESITIDATLSAAAVTMDFSLEADGQVNYIASDAGDIITFAINNLVDTYTLGAGADAITLDTNNTIANLANVDVITDFKASGADTLDSGTAHVPATGLTYTVNLASTTLADFAGAVNSALFTLPGYAAGATDAILVNVAGGAMAGTYLVQDVTGNSITADDFVVELVGAGIVTAADFV